MCIYCAQSLGQFFDLVLLLHTSSSSCPVLAPASVHAPPTLCSDSDISSSLPTRQQTRPLIVIERTALSSLLLRTGDEVQFSHRRSLKTSSKLSDPEDHVTHTTNTTTRFLPPVSSAKRGNRLFVCPSVCLSVCPSVRLSVRLSVCLSVCPSVCLSVRYVVL